MQPSYKVWVVCVNIVWEQNIVAPLSLNKTIAKWTPLLTHLSNTLLALNAYLKAICIDMR